MPYHSHWYKMVKHCSCVTRCFFFTLLLFALHACFKFFLLLLLVLLLLSLYFLWFLFALEGGQLGNLSYSDWYWLKPGHFKIFMGWYFNNWTQKCFDTPWSYFCNRKMCLTKIDMFKLPIWGNPTWHLE